MSTPTTTLTRTKHYLMADQVKAKFGFTQPASVLRLVKEQGLPAHKINRRYLFDPDEVDAWIGQNLTTGARATTGGDPDWVAAQVAKFSPDDLRRAGELLLALANSGTNTAGIA
ncbi:helix-turn-helix domain-containing protein [Mycobacteroides chelonae]|jgi:Helix-turn-helix domain|uniref:helix-turn-helix domain-containing protein n=1 Tax=Mycobacteroides chelonae TaxID=1774 RepID=UPI000D6EA84A|nr:helix-turn-helix domain-containing protein [Mycobacteroides chelonae]